jgi:hypothetical protein
VVLYYKYTVIISIWERCIEIFSSDIVFKRRKIGYIYLYEPSTKQRCIHRIIIAKKAESWGEQKMKNSRKRNMVWLLVFVVTVTTLLPLGSFAGEVRPQVSAGFTVEDFEISGSTVKGFSQSGMDKLADNPGTDLTLPNVAGGGIVATKAFSGKNLGGALIIPEGYQTIENQAFQNCNFTSATLPGTLNSLGTYAFASNKLTQVNLAATSLTTIPEHAFTGNNISSSP